MESFVITVNYERIREAIHRWVVLDPDDEDRVVQFAERTWSQPDERRQVLVVDGLPQAGKTVLLKVLRRVCNPEVTRIQFEPSWFVGPVAWWSLAMVMPEDGSPPAYVIPDDLDVDLTLIQMRFAAASDWDARGGAPSWGDWL